MPDSFEQMLRGQLDDIRKELSDLRDLVRGRPEIGFLGLLARIEASEKQLASLAKVQDSFVADRERERRDRERREKIRARITTAVVTVMTGVMVGILVQLFVLISNTGAHP